MKISIKCNLLCNNNISSGINVMIVVTLNLLYINYSSTIQVH